MEADKDARSVGGSHAVRKQASTTTGADRRWPSRNTVIHSARVTGSGCSSSGGQVDPSSSWSPLFGDRESAALPDWSCGGAETREDRHLGALKAVFCPQARALEAAVTRTHTLLLRARWVAHRLPGRHSSVTASPLRCRSGLLMGQYLGGVLRRSFARRHRRGHC